MASPAQVDDSAQTVYDVLADTGDGTLPSLTREELFVLSDEPVLAHPGDRDWWHNLDDAGRDLVGQTAQRGLVARNLLTAAVDGDGLVVDARVRVVLRARREPSWLVVLGEPADTDVQIVAGGIDLRADETDAALVSARLEGIYLNRLLGPASAISVLVEWLLREPSQTATPTGRTVEVIRAARPGTPGQVRSSRAIVLVTVGGQVICDVDAETAQPGDPRPVNAAALHRWLVAAIGLQSLVEANTAPRRGARGEQVR